jgi:hypothetical protein
MIKNKEIAREISALMLEFSGRLNDSVWLVKENCSEEELGKYKKGVGAIMGDMATEILNPLYRENPDLKPKEYYLPGVDPTEQ